MKLVVCFIYIKAHNSFHKYTIWNENSFLIRTFVYDINYKYVIYEIHCDYKIIGQKLCTVRIDSNSIKISFDLQSLISSFTHILSSDLPQILNASW